MVGCSKTTGIGGAAGDASPETFKANAQFAQELKLDDAQDFEDAKRGFIAKPTGQIKAADGTVLKDFEVYAFLDGKAPDTVNPSLWRHAQLNAQIGLFKVTDGVYQLRGFDIANMTLIEGKTGWIVGGPLTARETSAAALAFARQHLGDKPVSAVIITHAHADHFGGVLGIVTRRKWPHANCRWWRPKVSEEATSENVMVGTGMARRSIYQFGRDLPRTAKGNVDTGLGKGRGLRQHRHHGPNHLIEQPEQKLQLDGVDFVFYNVPGPSARPK